MTSYTKYTFNTDKPHPDATGKLYKCKTKQPYDSSYKLYEKVDETKYKDTDFTLCTLATDDYNKRYQPLRDTIDKIEANWKNEHGKQFSAIKIGIFNNCMIEKKNNYYDVLDIMLKPMNIARVFMKFDNFKIFLRDVLLKDTRDLGISIPSDRMTLHVNASIDELTDDEKKKLNSFVIISKIIKLVVGDILGQIFDIQSDYEDVDYVDDVTKRAIDHNIKKDEIKDDHTLLKILLEKSINKYVDDFLSSKGTTPPQNIKVSIINNILEYRNNLIKEYFISLYNSDERNLNTMLEPNILAISELYNQFSPQHSGGSNRKPHTRINYINNKNMYYNL